MEAAMKRALLVLNCILLFIGGSGGPLLTRLYFIHGGSRLWFSSWLQTGGFPIFLLPLSIAYIQHHRRNPSPGNRFFIGPRLFIASVIIGILTGLDDFLMANGMARLPISTSALISATQLAFTAGFAFLLVRQKFTAYSVNALVLLTIGAAVLAMHGSSDRPEGESSKEYMFGFVMMIGAAALYGFIMPFLELVYAKAGQEITYAVVMQIQMVICVFATGFSTVGMVINNDFKVIPREAREFEIGETKYYLVVVWSAVAWQFSFLGVVGIVFCASSLLSGVMVSLLIPVTEVLGVIFLDEKFRPEKGVALALSIWGFISYFYGEARTLKKQKHVDQDTEMQQV
ncbi:purine permease 1-like [Carica papaya]|uniref:purine permease 1-like n=1 Tax=Carica papaya TaxID=3649 RepID=UPI000B8CA64B|nr:purine permease 1-like [Carica papaya]